MNILRRLWAILRPRVNCCICGVSEHPLDMAMSDSKETIFVCLSCWYSDDETVQDKAWDMIMGIGPIGYEDECRTNPS